MAPLEAPSIAPGVWRSEVLAALWGRDYPEMIQALFLIPSALLRCASSVLRCSQGSLFRPALPGAAAFHPRQEVNKPRTGNRLQERRRRRFIYRRACAGHAGPAALRWPRRINSEVLTEGSKKKGITVLKLQYQKRPAGRTAAPGDQRVFAGPLSCTWGACTWGVGSAASGSPADSFRVHVTFLPRRHFLFSRLGSVAAFTWIPPPAPDSPTLIECLRDNLHFLLPQEPRLKPRQMFPTQREEVIKSFSYYSSYLNSSRRLGISPFFPPPLNCFPLIKLFSH